MRFQSVPLLIVLILLGGCYGLPSKKVLSPTYIDDSKFTPPPDKATLVIIRPYNFYYFGHPIQIHINDIRVASLPNQTYTVAKITPGHFRVSARSGTMGPPNKEIDIDVHEGQVMYLEWQTREGAGSKFGPTVFVKWSLLPKERASALLTEVEFVATDESTR